MGNQTSASGVRSRTTTSGGAAQQQQTQQAEHEYDPYVQGGVSGALCRIWMHAGGERWERRSGIHQDTDHAERSALMQVWGSPRCLNEYTVFLLFVWLTESCFLLFFSMLGTFMPEFIYPSAM